MVPPTITKEKKNRAALSTRNSALHFSAPNPEMNAQGSEEAAALERAQQRTEQMDALSMKRTPPESEGDWRSTVGMFAGDPIMREVSKEARRIRNAQRSG